MARLAAVVSWPLFGLLALTVLSSPAASLVVPLRRHERSLTSSSKLRRKSFLALDSTLEARLDLLRERHNNTHAIEYYGDVIVGGQSFSVIFDTGSDQLALPGVNCVSDACQSHRLYDASKSKTAGPDNEDSDSARELTFATGTASGFLREETVCLADACTRAEFVESLEESDDPFLHAKFDGVLGLSLQLRSESTSKTSVLQALADSKAIPRAVFAVFMAKDLHSDTSEISFGEANAERAGSSTTWVQLSDPGYWQFALSGIDVGGKDLQVCAAGSDELAANTTVSAFFGKMCCRTVEEFEHEERCQFQSNFTGWRSKTAGTATVLATYKDGRVAVKMEDGCVQKVPKAWLSLPSGCRGDGSIQTILDTGSSLMMASKSIVDKISAAIGVRENCTAQQGETFPSLSFRLPDGHQLTLTPDDYMDTIQDGDNTFCWLHLMAMPEVGKGSVFVLGMPFLRAYYTTFDAEQHRVGFAKPQQPGHLADSKAPVAKSAKASGARHPGHVAIHGRRPE
eukprot:TRINITY_DN12961_c0_g1_i1.p1 TRINITY_DN12961_c0_g1~~TRINITY_DN12961_c0_g1_i1.p1  ORF type:complete len:513 (-),score=122.66 TRINITY_DN12961_c0_g1_i1:175-1713(-)